MPNYYSQHGEDRWIVEHLELPEKGVFVEVGAFDGVNLSNTKHFEEKGWTGLCIEADPRSWSKLLQNRTCDVYLGAAGHDRGLKFECNDEPTHSGFGRGGVGIRVPVLPLNQLLVAHGIEHIDLLSLDTEGTELDVWNSGMFATVPARAYSEYRPLPAIVIIEWETHGLPSNETVILEKFQSLPYRLVHRNEGNLIFKRSFETEG
jgi:FkbM family methyltransferase